MHTRRKTVQTSNLRHGAYFMSNILGQVSSSWKHELGSSQKEQNETAGTTRKGTEQLYDRCTNPWLAHMQLWPQKDVMKH